MKKYTKEEAAAIVVQCAERYRDELDGRNLLFICQDRHKLIHCIEVAFRGSNYMHLTGLKASRNVEGDTTQAMFANDFYNKCLAHKLSLSAFDFAEDGTTHMKLCVLPQIICKNLHARIIGDYNSSKPRLYTEKIVGGVHACMGFVSDAKTSEYIPNTVIQEDIRNLTTNDVRVIAVYRKKICALRYEEITYKAKNVDWSTVVYPEKFRYLRAI